MTKVYMAILHTDMDVTTGELYKLLQLRDPTNGRVELQRILQVTDPEKIETIHNI